MNRLIKGTLAIAAAAAVGFGSLAPATAAPTASAPIATHAAAFQALVPAAAKKPKPKYVAVKTPAVVTGKIKVAKVSSKKKVTLTVGELVTLGKKSGKTYTVSHNRYGQLKVPAKYLKSVTQGQAQFVRNTTQILITNGKQFKWPATRGNTTRTYNFAHQGKTLTWTTTTGGIETKWVPTKDIKPIKQNVYQLKRDVVAYKQRGYPLKNTYLKKGSKLTTLEPTLGINNGEDMYKGKSVQFAEVIVGAETYFLPLYAPDVKKIGTKLGKTK